MLGIDVEAARDALRDGDDASLRRRRWIVALGALGIADFTVISLYQTGIVRSLPDLPGKIFDSNAVNAATKAYETGVPDGTTGLIGYALPMALAAAGGTRETGRRRWMDWLTLGAAGAGAAAGLYYLYDMVLREKRACVYCITGAGLHFAMTALAVKELQRTSG